MILWEVLFVEVLLVGSLFWSWYRPEYRIWPPPGKHSWFFWFVWGAIIGVTIGLIWLGFQYGDPESSLNRPTGIVGLFLIGCGLALAIRGITDLGVRNSSGLEGDLITEGIYEYTRNPQYLGDIMIIAGWIFISWTWTVWLTGGLAIAWFIFTPYVEEPWLEKRFGQEYRNYQNQVARFFALGEDLWI